MFITLIKIERVYANSVVNNDMDCIIDIFGRRNGRESYFFKRALWAYVIDSFVRIFSLRK